MFEHLLQELLARVLTVISSAFYPRSDIFSFNFDFKILAALNSCHLCVGIDDVTKILAVSELQRVFLESLGHQKGSHGFDVCDVLVLTVCEHLPSPVLTQCINTTFRQVFKTKWSQRRGVSVLMLIPTR